MKKQIPVPVEIRILASLALMAAAVIAFHWCAADPAPIALLSCKIV